MIVATCQRISEAPAFHAFVTAVVVAAAVLVGVETSPALHVEYHGLLEALDRLVLTIFCVEIVINMVAQGNKPWNYFRNPWNIFDFTIVVAAFLPFAAQYVTVLRLLRVMRVLKLVHAVPKLQVLVGALFKSLPSMTYVSAFLFLLFYVYAVTGTFVFGGNDPAHFGTLGLSLLTLFRIVTLEGWTEMLYTAMHGCDKVSYVQPELCTHPEATPAVAVVFFVSFILLGTMIIMNLFVGVIMNGMSEAQEEAEQARVVSSSPSLVTEMHEMGRKLEEMQKLLLQMHARVGRQNQRGGTPLDGGTRIDDTPPTSMS